MYSRGIPRVVNLLCEHALINAYVESVRHVPAHMVQEVARDFQLDEIKTIPQPATLNHALQAANTQALLENLTNCWVACAK